MYCIYKDIVLFILLKGLNLIPNYSRICVFRLNNETYPRLGIELVGRAKVNDVT